MKRNQTLIMMSLIVFSTSYATDLKAGQKYKIVKPVYLIAEYNSRSDKTLSKDTAIAYLESASRAQMSYMAFQNEVPAGAVMTIIGRAPKPWYLYFQGDIYFVKIDPDMSQGLEIKIQLDRGMEGNLDGLNSEFFSRL